MVSFSSEIHKIMTNTAHYEKFGYVVLKQFFNRSELQSIEDQVDPIFESWRSRHEADIFKYKMLNMHSLTLPEYFMDYPRRRVDFFNGISSKKLINGISEIFGRDLHFHNTQLFFNPSNPERLPYWHRDMQYSSIDEETQKRMLNDMLSLHIRIPLIDEQGVEVIPKTHCRWDNQLERKVRFELEGHTCNEALPSSELVALSRGDILIFSAQMIHRGHYAANKERKALDLCIGKYHPLANQFFNKEVLPSQSELSLIDNNEWYKLASDMVAGKIPTTE